MFNLFHYPYAILFIDLVLDWCEEYGGTVNYIADDADEEVGAKTKKHQHKNNRGNLLGILLFLFCFTVLDFGSHF